MNDIDKKIEAALRSAAPASTIAEPNLAEDVLAAFRGRHRWITTAAAVLGVVLFATILWSLSRFLVADAVALQLRWGGLTLVLIIVLMFVKLWFWLEMHTNQILREVKRVELLLVHKP
jgi:hypothetical protein